MIMPNEWAQKARDGAVFYVVEVDGNVYPHIIDNCFLGRGTGGYFYAFMNDGDHFEARIVREIRGDPISLSHTVQYYSVDRCFFSREEAQARAEGHEPRANVSTKMLEESVACIEIPSGDVV